MADIKLHFNKESGKYKCNYCGHDLAASTSTTRLRGHLIGVPNTGTKSCPNVPDDVRKYLSLCEINKRQKTATGYIPSPSNLPPVETEGMTVAMTTLVLPPNGSGANNSLGNQRQENQLRDDEFDDLLRELESGANNHYIPSFSPELNNDFGNQGGVLRFTNEASLMMEETPNLTMASNESGSNLQPKALSSAADFISQDLRNCRLTDQADQHEVRDEVMVQQEVQMVEGNQEAGESASRAKRPVGEAFVRNEKDIWSWLMDDRVLRVGIYGMGGVGKTTLMRHIQTRLKGQSSLKVFWVTVSQQFSIWKLQDLIAKKIDLPFKDKEDEMERAEKLTRSLKAKGKYVLILDDLWNNVELDKVGISVEANGCKLVLTTRLLDVCRQMHCSEGNTIQLQRLSEEEAWSLFTQELGNYIPEVEKLAKAASRECGGLPLGIGVLARTMRGICNVHTWRNTLEELKESKVSEGHEMREEVFSVLKFSYLRLKDPALRECLSYCALFPEDDKIDRNELIEYMIVEGIIDAKKSRRAELDRGHTMLETLENACLLEGNTTHVWMHDLIRDMAIHELRERSNSLVETGEQLIELPDEEKWTENLVRVSLMGNGIEVIPYGHTPRCPNLSTLLLGRNERLRMIADSFFEQFQGLKVLDFHRCGEIKKLPGSISNLVNLTALLLRGCWSLVHIPSLAKLKKLKKLDLSGCAGIKEMPEGVEFLLNLKYLNLSCSGIKETESGTILILSRLQVLILCNELGEKEFSMGGREVGGLRMLETLHCSFSNPNELGEYVESRKSLPYPDYSFFIGEEECLPWVRDLGSRKFVSVTGYNFIYPLVLPTDIEALNIHCCYSPLYKRLFPLSLLASLLNLQEIRVGKWGAIEEIFTMNQGENGEWRFPFSNYATHSLPDHSLLNLKLIDIWECHKLKKLFPPCLLPNLHNLQKISVGCCYGMEEIFSTDQEEGDGQELLFDQPNLTGLHLSRLTTLKLRFLPELRSIYKGVFICHSLQQIQLLNCPKLNRIPLPFPQPNSLQRIQVYPQESWESLQWDNPIHKENLQPLCVFQEWPR